MAHGVKRSAGDGAQAGYYYAQGGGHNPHVPFPFGFANTNSSNNNGMEANASNVDLSKVQRCECCPYGYHIDLDFLNFCEEISTGANLKKIKKYKRSRPRHGAVKSIRPPPPIIPPRSSSLPSKRHRSSKTKLEPEKILEKENAAFWKIYQQFAKLLKRDYESDDLNLGAVKASFDHLDTQSLPPEPLDHNLSDIETESVISLPYGYSADIERRSSLPTYEVLQHALNSKMDVYNSNHVGGHLALSNLVSMSHQSGSTSSLSSNDSTNAFSPISHHHHHHHHNGGGGFSELDGLNRPLSSTSSIGDYSVPSGRSTPSSTISGNALAAVREQMAVALLRLKQLEEQVKAIPVLQVKISVLKEEKRLLMLQLKSKTKDKFLRHVGVCDGEVDVGSIVTINGDSSAPYYELPSTDIIPTSVWSPKPTRPFSPDSPGRAPSPRFGFHGNRPGSPGPSSPVRRQNSTSPSSPSPLSPQHRLTSPLMSPQQRIAPPVSPKPTLQGGKPTPPPVPPKKAYVAPVPRVKTEMRSVGVDANMIQPPKPSETRSVGINVDLTAEVAKVVTAKVEKKSKFQPVKLSSVHLRTVRSMTSWGNSGGNPESGAAEAEGLGNGSSTNAGARGKSLIREGPITATEAHNVTASPAPTADSQSLHPTTSTSARTSLLQLRPNLIALQPDCHAQLVSRSVPDGQLGAARQAVSENRKTESRACNTDSILQQECGTETISHATQEQGTSTEYARQLTTCEQGTNTSIIETRIMGTNTKPPVAAKRVDASISTDIQGVDASTEMEVIEMVEFGVNTQVKCQECGVNTLSVSREDRGTCPIYFDNVRYFKKVVGSEEDIKVMEVDSLQSSNTSTDVAVTAEKRTETHAARLTNSACNTEREEKQYVDCCVGDDTNLNGIICCRKADTHTIGTNTSQMLEAWSRTIGIGSCSISDSFCVKCDSVQLRSVASGGDRVSESSMRTRTIGTNHSVLSRTIGVGSDIVCDLKSLLGAVTVAVGDRDINDAMCNVCDKRPQRTIGTGIRVPVRDVSVGDGPVAGQINIGVGQCTVIDRICDRCDNLCTVSVAIGSTDVNRYTHSRSIQVGESIDKESLVSPLCDSPSKSGLTAFAELCAEENDSVFLPESESFMNGHNIAEETELETAIEAKEESEAETSPSPKLEEETETRTIAEMISEEVRAIQSLDVSAAAPSVLTTPADHASQDSDQNNLDMAPHPDNGTSQEPVSTGSLDYEIHINLDDQAMLGNGFTNPHAVLADDSPGFQPPKTTLAATIMKRGSQDSGTEGHISDTDLVESSIPSGVTMSSSSSGSDSSSSETDSDSSHSSGSSDHNQARSMAASGSRSGSPSKISSQKKRASADSKNKQGRVNGKGNGKMSSQGSEAEEEERVMSREEETEEEEKEVRQAFELGDVLRHACVSLGKLMEKQGDGNTRDLTTCLAIVAKDWFRITSQKTSEAHQVRGLIRGITQEAGKAVLERIVNLADSNGNTALHYSVSHGNFDIVLALLDTGVCHADRPNKAGYTTIMLASLVPIRNQKHAAAVSRLFREGDVNLRASQAGQTALMLAVSKGRLDMVKLLLTAGSEVNTRDEDGSTALMCASEHGHLDIVKLLLSHPQIDPHLEDNDGSTAFSIAMEAGHKDIGVLLYAHMNFKQAGSSKKKSSGPTSPQRHVSSSGSPSPRLSAGPSRSTSSSSISSLPTQGTSSSISSATESFSSSTLRGHSMLNLTTTTSSTTNTSSVASSTRGSRSQATSPTTEELPPTQLFRSRSLSPSSRTPSFRALQIPRSTTTGTSSSGNSRISTPPGGSPKRFAAILAAQRTAAAQAVHRATRSASSSSGGETAAAQAVHRSTRSASSSSGGESPAVQRRTSPTKKPYGAQGKNNSTGTNSTRASPRQTPLQKKGIKPSSKYSTV